MTSNPKTELQQGFSSEGASATPWEEVSTLMEKAKIYWLTTVRSNGQPNTSSLYGVWLDNVFYFATGTDERKTKNLKQNAKCNITTGCNVVEGKDIVVEGEAEIVSDDALLHTLAAE